MYLYHPCEVWGNAFPGVSEKATLQHKNYAAIYGKLEVRVHVKTTKINQTL